jgi:SAM-dependent methyltransferase
LQKLKVPFWVRIVAKIILSRLPFDYRLWTKLGLFRHGKMDEKLYVERVFNSHLARLTSDSLPAGKVVLELGPGDSVATAIFCASRNARSILIDSGDYATRDVSLYQSIAKALKEGGANTPNLSGAKTREDILTICNSSYFTNGLVSLKELPDSSVDFIFSQAVLEHVRLQDFFETLKQCRRILKRNGVASHRVDLKDHLGGGLNNLRFNRLLWESEFFVRSGFYTNRIRFSEMTSLMRQAGFLVEVLTLDRWRDVPIRRDVLAADFASVTDEDLLINGFDVLLRPKGKRPLQSTAGPRSLTPIRGVNSPVRSSPAS